MTVAGSGVCYLADWGKIFLWLTEGGSYSITSGCPVPASGDTIRLLVVGTTYTCTDVTTGASTLPPIRPIRLEIQPYWWISDGPQSMHCPNSRPTVPLLWRRSSPSPAPPAGYPAVDTFSGSGALSSNWTNTTSAGYGYVSLAQSGGTVAPSVSGQQD